MKLKFIPISFYPKKGEKVYTLINLLGLSISIVVALLIYGFVIKEVQTDRFHQNGQNIYRVLTKPDSHSAYRATDCGSLAPAIQNEVSGVESCVRIWPMDCHFRVNPIEEFGPLRSCFFADTSFFKIFTFPLTAGDIRRDAPRSWAVISEKIARQYFNDMNPVGKTLYLKSDYWTTLPEAYQIIAVMKDIPAWSTLQTDIVLDYRSVENKTNWYSNFESLTYVQLNPQTRIPETEKNIAQTYAAYQSFEGKIKLQPLHEIYYDKEQVQYTNAYLIPKGSLTFTRLLISITILILFLSSCNYMMIKIAQGTRQMKIFSIQRCYGATYRVIWKYFLSETTFYFVISGLFSLLLAYGLFPFF